MDDLTNEELVSQIQCNGDRHGDAILQLLRQNQGIIFLTAKPFIASGLIEEDEVRSIAFCAACGAVRYYQSGSGGFLTVFKWFLLKELLESSNRNQTVPLTRHARDLLRKYRRVCESYRRTLGREATDSELATALKVSEATLAEIRQAERLQSQLRLDAPVTDSEDGAEITTMVDTLRDNRVNLEDSVTDSVFIRQIKEALRQALATLPDDERGAIESQYFKNEKADRKALKRGLDHLSRQRKLARFLSIENEFASTSYTTFKRTQTSRPEFLVVQFLEGGHDGR